MWTCQRCLIRSVVKPRLLTYRLYPRQCYSRQLWPRSVASFPNASHGSKLMDGRGQRNYSSEVPEQSAGNFDVPATSSYELPLCCPGCGAYSQTIDPNEPGYYDEGRKQVRKHRAAVERASESKKDEQNEQDTQDNQATQEQAGDSKEKAETAARDIQLAIANSKKTGKEPRLSSAYSPYNHLHRAYMFRGSRTRKGENHSGRLPRAIHTHNSLLQQMS